MALKRKDMAAEYGLTESNSNSNGESSHEFEIRENPRVNAQIDDYIKQFPKRMAFIKSLPRERLERALIWEKVRNSERQHKLNDGLFRKIEQNPALKKAYDALIAQIPENERERAKVNIARTLVLSQSRAQRQNAPAPTQRQNVPAQKQMAGMGV